MLRTLDSYSKSLVPQSAGSIDLGLPEFSSRSAGAIDLCSPEFSSVFSHGINDNLLGYPNGGNVIDGPGVGDCYVELGAHTEIANNSKVKVVTTDLKAMGLAAGGKLGISHPLGYSPAGMLPTFNSDTFLRLCADFPS